MKFTIRIAVGVGILAVLFARIGLAETIAALAGFPVWAGLVFMMLLVANTGLGGLRLWALNSRCWRQSLPWFLLRYARVQFIGLIIPARLGDYLLVSRSESNDAYGESTAVITADKILAIASVLVLGELGLWALIPEKVAGFLLLATVMAVSLAFCALKSRFLREAGRKLLPARAKRLFDGFSAELYAIFSLRNMPRMSANIMLFAGRMVLSAAGYYVLFRASGHNVAYARLLLLVAADHLLLFAPVSIWALGLTESLFLAFLVNVDVPAHVVLGANLYWRILNLLLVSVVYFLAPKATIQAEAQSDRGFSDAL